MLSSLNHIPLQVFQLQAGKIPSATTCGPANVRPRLAVSQVKGGSERVTRLIEEAKGSVSNNI